MSARPVYDRKAQVVFCLIPKNMCTEMKAFFAAHLLNYSGGVGETWEEHEYIHFGTDKTTLLLKDYIKEALPLFEDDKVHKLVIIRDPIQRLISGFLDKCVGQQKLWVIGLSLKLSLNF